MLQAVSQASLELHRGETLGLVGESGSGKSTLARAVVGTVKPAAGKVLWKGQDLAQLGPRCPTCAWAPCADGVSGPAGRA